MGDTRGTTCNCRSSLVGGLLVGAAALFGAGYAAGADWLATPATVRAEPAGGPTGSGVDRVLVRELVREELARAHAETLREADARAGVKATGSGQD